MSFGSFLLGINDVPAMFRSKVMEAPEGVRNLAIAGMIARRQYLRLGLEPKADTTVAKATEAFKKLST